jgi:hypothetical protein
MDRGISSVLRTVYYVVVCDQPHHSITKARTGRDLVIFRAAQRRPDLTCPLILYPHVHPLECAAEFN